MIQANFDEMLRFLKGQRTSNNNEIKVMEEQAIMDFANINVLNSMQYKVKVY